MNIQAVLLSTIASWIAVSGSSAFAQRMHHGLPRCRTGILAPTLNGVVGALPPTDTRILGPTLNGVVDALPPTTTAVITNNGSTALPPTVMDSFVYNAGGAAEWIYGDEGTVGPPPLMGFTTYDHIQQGLNESGLTTGHGSLLPSAWGGDEFRGSEFSYSGPSGFTLSSLVPVAELGLGAGTLGAVTSGPIGLNGASLPSVQVGIYTESGF